MAFGDLTAKKTIDFTQCGNYGVRAINQHFGKFTFATSPVIETKPTETPLTNLKEEGIEVLS